MNKYLSLWHSAAQSLEGVAFFKIGLPIITVAGVITFTYFGIRGIITKQTILLFPFRELYGTLITPAELVRLWGPITGIAAVLTGIFYIIVALLIGAILGPLSFYILFKK